MNESTIELAALSWFGEIGFATAHDPDLAPDGLAQERESFGDVLLVGRLRDAIEKLNPDVPSDGLEEAFRKVSLLDAPTLIARNRQFHNWLRDGVEVEYRRDDGSIKGDRVRLVDFDDPANNDLLAVNQFVIREGKQTRIPDIVVFVNGLPLAVFEPKEIGGDDRKFEGAYLQLQTYRSEIPSLFDYNELLVISDGKNARIGSLTAGLEWFKPWPTIDSDKPVKGKLEILIRGAFEPERFLSLVRDLVLFEKLNRKACDAIAAKVEHLVASRIAGSTPDPEVTRWLAGLDAKFHARLVRLGLAEPRTKGAVPCLGDWLATYFEEYPHKASSKEALAKGRDNLLTFFGADMRLDAITVHDAKRFENWLRTQANRRDKDQAGLADGTVRRRVSHAKQFLGAAVDAEIIPKNPFNGLRSTPRGNPDRMFFVPPEWVRPCMDHAPDRDWVTILALCRSVGCECRAKF